LKGQPEINLFAKNVLSIVKTVAKRKFHLLVPNPPVKNVVSIAQNCCSKTLLFFGRTNPLGKNVVSMAQKTLSKAILFSLREEGPIDS